MITNARSLFYVTLLSFITIAESQAGQIATRTELNTQLGSAAVTEDLNGYSFPATGTPFVRLGSETLDATTTINNEGPGLIKPNIRFSSSIAPSPSGDGLTWDRQTEYLLQSAAVIADGALIIDFANPVTHVGFDFFYYDTFSPPTGLATIKVYAPDDTTVLFTTFKGPPPEAPASLFFGYTDPNGIGRVTINIPSPSSEGISPLVDNVTFGTAGTGGGSEPSTCPDDAFQAALNPVIAQLQTHLQNPLIPARGITELNKEITSLKRAQALDAATDVSRTLASTQVALQSMDLVTRNGLNLLPLEIIVAKAMQTRVQTAINDVAFYVGLTNTRIVSANNLMTTGQTQLNANNVLGAASSFKSAHDQVVGAAAQ